MQIQPRPNSRTPSIAEAMNKNKPTRTGYMAKITNLKVQES